MHQLILRLGLYVPLVAVCSVIYWFSSMRRPPIPHFMRFHYGDKVLHMIAFFAVGFCAVLPLFAKHRYLGLRLAVSALFLAAAYAGIDELHQSFVPQRDSSIYDFAADLIGATLGILCFWVVVRKIKGTSKQSSEVPR